MSESSPLVLVQPNDSIDDVAERVRATGLKQVQLLIPADTTTLRNRHAMADLRRQLAEDGLSLSVVSSDEHVLQAARQSGIEALAIEGAQVKGPLVATPRRRRPPTRPQPENMSFLMGLLSAGSGERLDRPSPAPRITKPVSTESPVSPNLAAEAATLEQLDSGRVPDRYSSLSAEDADLYSSFDDLSDVIQSEASKPRPEPRQRPAELEPEVARSREGQRERGDTRRSSRATEDIGAERVSRRRETEEIATERSSSRRSRCRPAQFDESVAPRRRRDMGFLLPLLLLLALLALLALGGYWLYSSRDAVTVHPPTSRVREEPIIDEVIPYNAAPGSDSAVIQAIPVQAEASYTVRGQVTNQVVSPTNRARGTVTLINTMGQAIDLPEGTEFIGRNAQGAEVRFVIDTPTRLPGATTSSSLTGSTITYGQLQVAVTARSAGATSNIPENTVSQILLPGQQVFDCRSGNVICRNDALGGGSDEPQWVVTEADVSLALQEALTGLYNAGVQQLRAQTDNVNTVIDANTIVPNDQTLGLPENYEPPIVAPAIGQPADPNTHTFSMTVKTRFNALATPANMMVQQQMPAVIERYFTHRTPAICNAAEGKQARIDTIVWDGASLKVSGAVICTPQGGFADTTRLRVRDALRGKTREEALAALQALKDEGLIGDFEIPTNTQKLPGFDILLNVQFAEK